MTDGTPPPLEDTLTLTLRKPVEFEGQTYAELVLREPTGGQMKAIGAADGKTVAALAIISNVPAGAVARIGARDMKVAADFLFTFLEGDLEIPWKTGAAPDFFPIAIDPPIAFAGQPWNVIPLREPFAGEIERFAGRGGYDAIIHSTFLVSAVPVAVLDQVGARKLRLAEAYLKDFL